MRAARGLAVLASLGAVAAQEPCARCTGTGLVACVRHADVADEATTLHCTVVAACRTCGGAGVVDCPECDAAVGDELARRRRDAQAFVDRVARELGPVAERSVTVELPFVRPTAGAEQPLRLDGRKVDAHALAHRCAAEVARVRAEFVRLFGLGADDFPKSDAATTADAGKLAVPAPSPTLRLVLLREPTDARRVAPGLVGLDLQGLGVLRLGPAAAACVRLDPAVIDDDDALVRLCATVSARLLIAQVVGSPGDAGHGWLEAGLAAHFEAWASGGHNGFLGFGERLEVADGTYRGGDWLEAARRLAASGQLRSLADLTALQHEELDLEATAQAFAFVELLLAEADGARLVGVVRAVVAGGDPPVVLADAYPSEAGTLDERFAAWLATRAPLR